MFTDLNKHAVKTSNSISELYDSRDKLAVITRRVIQHNDFLNTYTDKEKDILGKFSSNLFTLSTFYNANKRITRGKTDYGSLEDFLNIYWGCVVRHILPWNDLAKHELSKVDLRENYIITQSVMIQVLGRLGNYFYLHPDVSLEASLSMLENICWLRSAQEWQLRTIRKNGRMINSEEAVILTCNVIKRLIGIRLDENEQRKEQVFIGKVD